MKNKIKKGNIPDNDKNLSETTKKGSKDSKTQKSAAKNGADKLNSSLPSKKLSRRAAKEEKKKQEQSLLANVKITKHKSRIALILGILFVLASILIAGFATVMILNRPTLLVEISTIAANILTPVISFITTSPIGLYPTAIVFFTIGIGIFSIRNYKPWATVQLIIVIAAIYSLHLLFNQAYTSSFPQYLEIFFENNNIDTSSIPQLVIIYLIVDVVLLMVIAPICSTFNEKWQIKLIKLQIKRDKEIIIEQKEIEKATEIKLEEDINDNIINNEILASNANIDIPIPIDVPTLSFIDKTKVYDTNTVKENITAFSNVKDSSEPEILSTKPVYNTPDNVKSNNNSLAMQASLNNTPFDNLHTVSLSTLEMAKKNVEERIRKQNGTNAKTNRQNVFDSPTNHKVDGIAPISDVVRKFNQPTQKELDRAKSVTHNLFGGTKTGFTVVKKTAENRSPYENIMSSGHLINATKKNKSNITETATEKGSSISPSMNEILNRINEPTLKNANLENDTINNNNYYGNGNTTIGTGKIEKKEGRIKINSSQTNELSDTTKSFIDQLNASIALHPNNRTNSETIDNDFSRDNKQEVQRATLNGKQYEATSAPTEAEKNAMRGTSREPSVTSQLASGNDNYIEKKLDGNKVAVGNYNSTAKPVGGGVLVDEKEALVDDVDDEPMDLESSIAGLGRSRVVESARVKYNFPPLYLVKDYPETSNVIDEFTKQKAQRLIETLAEFKYNVTLRNIIKGPTVTMFEIIPDPGIRVNSITNLSDNIAMNLAAEKVRILAPIPGETAVGVEIPNSKRDIVGFKEILTRTTYNHMAIPMTIGRNLYGACKVFDVATSPHMLVAGSTGSGKSVCINSLICSILYTRTPKEVRLIMVDPKVVELTIYNGIPHLLTPVITETKRTLKALDFCIDEMERRNKMLSQMSVRNIKSYNDKIVHNKVAREKMPYIVVIIDEFASLMSTAGKDLDDRVSRLTAMSRAVGIHLVFATQRPSVDVITGVIKNNLPTRIAFGVTSTQDSRTIISTTGAENLLGKGDMLLSENGKSVSRLQGVFLSDDEVEQIVDFAKSQGPTDYIDESYFESYDDDTDDSYDQSGITSCEEGDDLWDAALKVVVERKSASASFLQRRLRIGYNRAARLVEEMEEKGIVGPSNGSKPRELLRYPDMVSN